MVLDLGCFDTIFSNAMDEAMLYVADKFNAKIGYTQSDEISIMFTDIGNEKSQMIYDGKVRKIISVAASAVTSKFNQMLMAYKLPQESQDVYMDIREFPIAEFDARVLVISDIREVVNYFIHRQNDCTRNSISMAAYAELEGSMNGVNTSQMQDMLMEKGINWNDYPVKFKRGVVCYKDNYQKLVNTKDGTKFVTRRRWVPDEPPIFTKDNEYLYNIINS